MGLRRSTVNGARASYRAGRLFSTWRWAFFKWAAGSVSGQVGYEVGFAWEFKRDSEM